MKTERTAKTWTKCVPFKPYPMGHANENNPSITEFMVSGKHNLNISHKIGDRNDNIYNSR